MNKFRRTRIRIGEADPINTNQLFSEESIDALFRAKDKPFKDFLIEATNPKCSLPTHQIATSSIANIQCNVTELVDTEKLTKFANQLSEAEKIDMISYLDRNLLRTLYPNNQFNNKAFMRLIRDNIKNNNTQGYLIAKKLNQELINSFSRNRQGDGGSLMATVCYKAIDSSNGPDCNPHLVNIIGMRCQNNKQQYHILDSYGQRNGIWVDSDTLSRGNISHIFSISN